MKKLIVPVFLLFVSLVQGQVEVLLPPNLNENDTKVKVESGLLELTWPLDGDEVCKLTLNVRRGQPLFKSMAIGLPESPKIIGEELDPVFLLNVGSRTLKPENGWTIFFDKVPSRPYISHRLDLKKKNVEVKKIGQRTIISISRISAPNFEGVLEITVYNGIPLFNIAAVVSTGKDSTAILYDAGLASHKPWKTIFFKDNSEIPVKKKGHLLDSSRNEAVKYRTVLGSNGTGAIAIFPAPHQYFYPLDEAYNLKSVWYGPNYRNMVQNFGLGIRQDPKGDERYVPWFNAPPGTEQRLNFFCLLDAGSSPQLLEEVKRFTHDDRYKKVAGYKTMSSHFHNEFIMNVVMADKPVPQKPEFVEVFKKLGVDIVHLGEFHYTAHPKGPDEVRLLELEALFDQCERLSNDDFLLLPGEEPNEFFGGHWMAFFPDPVYWIMARGPGKSFLTQEEPFGKVYRIGNKDDMLRLLELENGLAWTAHPRIKGSTAYPDTHKNEEFFKSDRFLGGAWKPMPADLSQNKLGSRVLNLMDDMNNWGVKKKVIAEADLFTITHENEMYAHMNVNYLQLGSLPKYKEGWQPVLETMKEGRFFSTTGEIVLPTFTVNGKGAGETVHFDGNTTLEFVLHIDWTFPLKTVEIISGDGQHVFHDKIDMSDTRAFQSQKLEFQRNLRGREWVRMEVWDVAANGAFTQTVYLRE